MNSKFFLNDIKNRINKMDIGQADIILDNILFHYFGHKRLDYLIDENKLGDKEKNILLDIVHRIEHNEPIQYIIGEVTFCDLNFIVNTNVLIPRPETEELVYLIRDTINNKQLITTIVDVCCGSGCIGISLKSIYSKSKVSCIDISTDAINLAKKNALNNNLEVDAFVCDILNEEIKENYDLIVSNPPYICEKEKENMQNNVLDFEPHIALFVPDKDPLIFYERIISIAEKHLRTDGYLFFEINEQYGMPVANLFNKDLFEEVCLRKDISGKDRFVYAKKL